MPYYLCPKCGSRESYLGTDIRSGTRGAILESPIDGVYLSQKQRDQEVSVYRCKDCDCLLGKKDLRQTAEELKAERDKRQAQKQESELQKKAGEKGCVMLFIASLGFAIGTILFLSDGVKTETIAIFGVSIFLFVTGWFVNKREERKYGELKYGKRVGTETKEKKSSSKPIKPNPSNRSDKCPQCDGKLMVTPKGTVQCMKCSYSG